MIRNKYLTILYFLSFLLMAGCEDQPLIPVYDPELFVSLRGADSINYKSAGVVNIILTEKNEQLALSTVTDINNTRYSVSIYLFFLDKKEKTGTFPFTNSSNKYTTDYAVGLIQIGDSKNPKQFLSQSGTLNITTFDSTRIVGTFAFTATDSSGSNTIYAKDGVIDFTY